jgi:uncharacterized membrane protein SpoIIM required for sporulation/ABC-type transport system involved in multi-copper enzyme maturation permease subunit
MTTTLAPNQRYANTQSPEAIEEEASHTLGETLRNAMIVTRREMRDSLRDWRIMIPIFVLTLVFPALAQAMTTLFANFFIQYGAEPLVDNFLPLLPMIVGFFPISISLVIALETFVGEKERRSLEPLLSTPLTNLELYIGKTFAATLPPLFAAYVGIAIYLGTMIFGTEQWRPSADLIIQILLLTTVQALVMVTGAVIVSSQTTSTRASNLLASFIIIPASLLVLLESYIMITDRRVVLWWIFLALVVVVIIMFNMGARIFNREELLGRAIDDFNIKSVWRTFRNRFVGGAKTPIQWYRHSVFPVLRHLRTPLIILIGCSVFAFSASYVILRLDPLYQETLANGTSQAQMRQDFSTRVAEGAAPGIRGLFIQNARAMLLAMFFAVFTFGSTAVLISAFQFVVIGALVATPMVTVLGGGAMLAALLPHGILEIPALLLAGAAAFRWGAIITRPPAGKGVWSAWLEAGADWFKVYVGLTLPMLFIAAIIESRITPQIVIAVLGG